MSRVDLFNGQAVLRGYPDGAWGLLTADEQREWRSLEDVQREAFLDRVQPEFASRASARFTLGKPDVQASGQPEGKTTLEMSPELQETVRELLADIKAELEEWNPFQASEAEIETEESAMKMRLTRAEHERLKAEETVEVELTDEQAQQIIDKRSGKPAPIRRVTLDDLEEGNWKRLSDGERTEFARQIRETADKAVRGE